ncbi:NAD-dependent epimerase/dehydratase family protein [Bacteroidota bacterium]
MILVTGGTGLLGSHLLVQLVVQLVASNQKVRAIYRDEKSQINTLNTFRYYHDNAEALFNQIEWVEGDMLDVMSLEAALDGINQVYHCAATVSFEPKDEPFMNKVNIEGTANLVNLCLPIEGLRFCFVSSVAAIGREKGIEEVITEENEWKESKFNSAYAVSKQGAEMEVWRGITEGLDAFMVNPSVILGPGDWTKSSGALFSKVWKGLPFYTRGGNCFVDARDVSDAMIGLMNTQIKAERFIVGAENRFFRDVFARIAKNMGKTPPSIEALPWMAELTWRVEKVTSVLARKKPFITKETARQAMHINRYDSSKLLNALPAFRFRKLDASLDFICEQFMKDYATPR